MDQAEVERKWKAFLKQLETVHRFLFMYMKMLQIKGIEGESVLAQVEGERYQELEDGLTQYAASLSRYLPVHFGQGAHLVISKIGAASFVEPPQVAGAVDAEAAPKKPAAESKPAPLEAKPAPPPPPPQAKTAEEILVLAQAAIAIKDFPRAEGELERLLADKPRHSEALRLLLSLKQFQGDPEAIMSVGLRLCQADPAEPAGYEALAHYFYGKKQQAKAQNLLMQAAEARINQKQYEGASILLDRVLAEDAAHPAAKRLKERLAQEAPPAPKPEPAPVAAPPAPPAAPVRAQSLEDQLAVAEVEIYEGTKHIDNAIAAYRQALKMDPNNSTVKARLNWLYQWMASH